MKKFSSFLLLVVLFILSACGNEEVKSEPISNENKVVESKDTITSENEFITAAADYARENDETLDQLAPKLKDFDEVEDSGWQIDINNMLMDIYMTDTTYVMKEVILSDEQVKKYESTIDAYYQSSKLLNQIIDETSAALETYDKRKLEEMKDLIPKAKEHLDVMKTQLEEERYN